MTGEGGLLARLTKTVIDAALEGEMDDHVGYSKHDPAGRNGGNSRNRARAKTVLTEVGPLRCRVLFPLLARRGRCRRGWRSSSRAVSPRDCRRR